MKIAEESQVVFVVQVALAGHAAEWLRAAQNGRDWRGCHNSRQRLARLVQLIRRRRRPQPAEDGQASSRAKLAALLEQVVVHARRHGQHARIRVAELVVAVDARQAPLAAVFAFAADSLFCCCILDSFDR